MTTPIPTKPLRNKQRGAALIIMGLILVLGLITLFTFNMERKTPELEADRKTAMALAQAKEALLGNSAVNGIATGTIENPGRLPCPDLDNNGSSQGAVCASYVGRFPWKTLGLSDLRDGASERLWYVLDAGFFDNGAVMNSTSISNTIPYSPALDVNGSKVVAVIIAPGPSLTGQQRDIPNENNLANYLESYVDATKVIQNSASSNYNDRMITVTASDLFSIVTFRMAKDLASLNSTPYPSEFSVLSTSTAVWDLNSWTAAVDFSVTTVESESIKLKFLNCAIIYTISGSTVTRNQSSCEEM